MASITGANTNLAVTLSSVFDTVTAPGTGHKLQVDGITHSKGLTELTENPIGSGLSMQQDSDTGDYKPTVSFSKTVRSDDQGHAILAAFFGQETVNVTGTGNIHSLTHQGVSLTNYINLAFQTDTAGVAEYINGVCTKVGLSFDPNDYMKQDFELLFTEQRITGTTATTANLAAATEPTSRVNYVVRPSHYVRMNAQAGGALANGDAVSVIKADLQLMKERELVGEIRGASGYGAPRVSGNPPFSAELTLTFKTLADLTYFTAVNAGTEYKADIVVQGTLISGSTYNTFIVLLPRLKIVTDPDYNPSSPGENPLTVKFRTLVASSVPSGMTSVYPSVNIINNKAAKYWN